MGFLRYFATFKGYGGKGQTDLVHDDMTVCGELQPVLDELQPPLRAHPDELLELCTVETLRGHNLCVTLRPHEVPVGEDGLVGVPDDEDPPSSEESDVMYPPVQAVLCILGNIGSSVVSLLEEGRAVIVVSSLSIVTSREDTRVIVHRPCEGTRGCLHQVPDQRPRSHKTSYNIQQGMFLRVLGIVGVKSWVAGRERGKIPIRPCCDSKTLNMNIT